MFTMCVSTFQSVFGPKKCRKKPNLKVRDFEAYTNAALQSEEKYEAQKNVKDYDLIREDDGVRDAPREWIMSAGQSKRIWNELYKVIDSSDVVIQVYICMSIQGRFFLIASMGHFSIVF